MACTEVKSQSEVQLQYTKFCQRRFAELMQSDPQACQDKAKVCAILAEEWKEIKKQIELKLEVKSEASMLAVEIPQSEIVPTQAYIERPRQQWTVNDGRPPKKALSSYMIYVKERKFEIMRDNPQLAFANVMQAVADKWRTLSEEERLYYTSKADEDKQRYAIEMELWNQHLSNDPQASQTYKLNKLSGGAKSKQVLFTHSQSNLAGRPPKLEGTSPAQLLRLVQQQQGHIERLLQSKKVLEAELKEA
jgi:hypothetical protein